MNYQMRITGHLWHRGGMEQYIVRFKLLRFAGLYVVAFLDVVCGLIAMLTLLLYRPYWNYGAVFFFAGKEIKSKYIKGKRNAHTHDSK